MEFNILGQLVSEQPMQGNQTMKKMFDKYQMSGVI
jgi:hypothetical protein